jgi:PAS domain-containing protein
MLPDTHSVDPVQTSGDISRRWMHRLAQLRSRSGKLLRPNSRTSRGEEAAALLETALEICQSLLQELAGLEATHEGMRRVIEAEGARGQYLFEQIPVPSVLTDAVGQIIAANPAAAGLLNVGVKHIQGRLLVHFVEDREAFATLWRGVRLERTRMTATIRLRPKERAPRDVDVVVVPETPENESAWLWFLLPSSTARELTRTQPVQRKTTPFSEALTGSVDPSA